MIAVLCAKTTADALEEKGIYELVIDVARLPYLDCKKTFLWGDRQIADVVSDFLFPLLSSFTTIVCYRLLGMSTLFGLTRTIRSKFFATNYKYLCNMMEIRMPYSLSCELTITMRTRQDLLV